MSRTGWWSLLACSIVLSGCFSGGKSVLAPGDATLSSTQFYSLGDEIPADQQIQAYIDSYRTGLLLRLDEPVTISTGRFENSRPEGSLGNLGADIIRRWAMHIEQTYIDIGVMNLGGLRVPLSEGPITIGTVYELMPFENQLTILELKGDQILEMAAHIASRGGEGISGMRMTIRDGKPESVVIGTQGVDPNRTYTVATNNYVADGGDGFVVFTKAVSRKDSDLLIRDVIIDYMRSKKTISPVVDGRLRRL
jgi:2',3'-cyclic-nucleotide 2'-phosphodiesterase (5'-nucleotidase family)